MSNSQLESCPKVSVAMITYNHEQFIEQAVRSVMMQETDFDYELIIGEDCSTDNTREIVLRLKEEFPDKIKLILHTQNVGMMKNFITVYEACEGKYVALLEGDDYWTDAHKLSIQVEYMEVNLECSMCFHLGSVFNYDANNFNDDYKKFHCNDITTVSDLIDNNYIILTMSMLFRNAVIDIPDWFVDVKNGDTVLQFLLVEKGHLCCIERNMGTYRRHNQGVYSSSSTLVRLLYKAETFSNLNERYDYLYCDKVNINNIYAAISLEYLKQGTKKLGWKYFKMSIFSRRGGFPRFRNIIRIFILLYIPIVYYLYKSLNETRKLRGKKRQFGI